MEIDSRKNNFEYVLNKLVKINERTTFCIKMINERFKYAHRNDGAVSSKMLAPNSNAMQNTFFLKTLNFHFSFLRLHVLKLNLLRNKWLSIFFFLSLEGTHTFS